MDEIGQKNKKSMLTIAIRWVFGIFFLLSSVVSLSSSFIVGLLFFLAAIISIPPAAEQLEKKLKVSISGGMRFVVVFVLLILAPAASPHIDTSTAVNNSTNAIAAPPSSASGSEAIAVPSEPTHVATPTPTPTPEVKETATSIPKVTETPESIPEITETPEVTPVVAPEVTPTPATTPEVTPTLTPTSKSASSFTFTQITTPTPTTREIYTGGTVYASSESNKYHSAGCRYVSKIKPEHLITFNSRQEAEAAGYSACKVCGG